MGTVVVLPSLYTQTAASPARKTCDRNLIHHKSITDFLERAMPQIFCGSGGEVDFIKRIRIG
jgi:hypothetical protein